MLTKPGGRTDQLYGRGAELIGRPRIERLAQLGEKAPVLELGRPDEVRRAVDRRDGQVERLPGLSHRRLVARPHPVAEALAEGLIAFGRHAELQPVVGEFVHPGRGAHQPA